MNRNSGIWLLALGLLEVGCTAPPGDVGELPGAGSTTEGDSMRPPDASESGDGGTKGSDHTTGTDTTSGGEPSHCGPGGPSCIEDEDRDCVALGDDNAPKVSNPDQSDFDGDGVGDVVDDCPSVASIGDSDEDGLGNECDPCRRTMDTYNGDAGLVPGYMAVRNIPTVDDADGDGIGDPCDNCVVIPNCEGYGPGNEWQPGDPIDDLDPAGCQADADGDLVGDACEGLQLPGAAGVVGHGPDDDFDQDGLRNVVDACPRSPLADAIACSGDAECPDGRACELGDGLCDHSDVDADGVGDACDSCSTVQNPEQVLEGGSEIDDPDGDFVGTACEGPDECSTRATPARVGFYPVAVEGWCCTVQYPGDGVLLDPDGRIITLDCDEASGLCRQVPPALHQLPGVIGLPPGCEAALADAGLTIQTHAALTPDDVGGLEGLWPYSCRLPSLDQDFDGLPQGCDLCPLAFDPGNEPFIDVNGQPWPDDGRYCTGEYSLESSCPP